MRLVITQNISLDGVIEQSDTTGEWFTVAGTTDTDDVEAALRAMMAQESAQLYGKDTFEAMRGYWPLQTDDTTGVTNHLNRVHKYVISTTTTDPGWENSTVLDGELLDEVRTLKAEAGDNLGVTGSISVCRALIAADLVDEYRLLLYPVVVGAGRRLFDTTTTGRRQLELLDSTTFASGITLLTYQPA